MSHSQPGTLIFGLACLLLQSCAVTSPDAGDDLSQQWSRVRGHRLGLNLRKQYRFGPFFAVASLQKGIRDSCREAKSRVTGEESRKIGNEVMERYLAGKSAAGHAFGRGDLLPTIPEPTDKSERVFREKAGYIVGKQVGDMDLQSEFEGKGNPLFHLESVLRGFADGYSGEALQMSVEEINHISAEGTKAVFKAEKEAREKAEKIASERGER